jgi:hypothetical protein
MVLETLSQLAGDDRIMNRDYSLGSYATKTEAAIAYNIESVEFHGPFARLQPGRFAISRQWVKLPRYVIRRSDHH